jgi:hypothetical protein
MASQFQETLGPALQDQMDTFQLIALQNREIAEALPIQEAMEILVNNVEDEESAIGFLNDYVRERWLPLIPLQVQTAVNQAAETILEWENKL